MSTAYFDHRGRPVTLGPQRGVGGEGTVYDVVGAADVVAKVYHKPPPPERADKLTAMVALARPDLLAVAAWPEATLHQGQGGPVRGLLMPKVKDYKELHYLYSPAHRKATFPRADWRFLAHAAANAAAAIDAVHATGAVVGDVNSANILVSEKGLIALIDCDSFQVTANGRVFGCEVGVPLFTPPELQDKPFRGVVRTPDHDAFGLAVLTFHLLFMGRHPFSGRYLGPGDMPIERAIAERRFAYGREAERREMRPPLHTLPLTVLPAELADLFESAFAGANRPAPRAWHAALTAFAASLRPCTADPGHVFPPHLATCPWCALIQQGAPNFFIAVGVLRAPAGAASTFVLAAVWTRIEQIARPTLAPLSLPTPAPTPWPSGLAMSVPAKPKTPKLLRASPEPPDFPLPPPVHRSVRVLRGSFHKALGYVALIALVLLLPVCVCASKHLLATAVLFLLCGPLWLAFEVRRFGREVVLNEAFLREQRAREAEQDRLLAAWVRDHGSRIEETRQQYEAALSAWELATALPRAEADRRRRAAEEARTRAAAAERNAVETTTRHQALFDRKKAELQALRQRHVALAPRQAKEQRKLGSQAREAQLGLFLQKQFLGDHKIDGIGPSRLATLASFGIETAFDVEEKKIYEVPGFGVKLTARLVAWRREVEKGFQFDASAPLPPGQVQALDAKFEQEARQIETGLLTGEKELNEIARRAAAELTALAAHWQTCAAQRARAEADLTVVPAGL